MRFQDEPRDNVQSPLPIVRCRPGRPLGVILCQNRWRGLDTHYWRKRTIPCVGLATCEPCQANQAARWQGFIICQSTKSKTFALLTFTPGVLQTLREALDTYGTLVGVELVLSRLGDRINAPLTANVAGVHKVALEFPTSKLDDCLKRLFAANARRPVDTIS